MIVRDGAWLRILGVAAGGGTATPSLFIVSSCAVEIEQGSGIEAVADGGRIGKIAILGANIELDGAIQASAPNGGRLGSVELTAFAGNLNIGPTARIETRGDDGDGSRILLETCGPGDLTVSGLVESHFTQGDPASIQLRTGEGDIQVDGVHDFGVEPETGRKRFAGIRVFAGNGATAGRVTLDSGKDLRVHGYGYQPPVGVHATFTFDTPISGDSVPVTVTFDQNGPDAVAVTVFIPEGAGDLLGLFGNITDEGLLSGMSVGSPDGLVTGSQFEADSVWKVGGGNNVNPVKHWDYGLRFDRQGGANGMIENAVFTLHGAGLTVDHLVRAQNQGWLLGIRIQSTHGPEGSGQDRARGPARLRSRPASRNPRRET